MCFCVGVLKEVEEKYYSFNILMSENCTVNTFSSANDMYKNENCIHTNKKDSMPLESFFIEILSKQYLSRKYGCGILHDKYFFLQIKLRPLSSSEYNGD